jgi:hypothetical protein
MKTQLFAAMICGLAIFSARAEEEAFERRPISYSTTAPHDSITALKLKLAAGEIRWEGDEKSVVRHLLSALGIPEGNAGPYVTSSPPTFTTCRPPGR